MQEEQDVFLSAERCVINGFPAMCPSWSIKAWLQLLPCVVMTSVLYGSLEGFCAGQKSLKSLLLHPGSKIGKDWEGWGKGVRGQARLGSLGRAR